jgi:hypothetical protein
MNHGRPSRLAMAWLIGASLACGEDPTGADIEIAYDTELTKLSITAAFDDGAEAFAESAADLATPDASAGVWSGNVLILVADDMAGKKVILRGVGRSADGTRVREDSAVRSEPNGRLTL